MADSKKEIEEFAYIVSHDLNAPLRHIKSFGNLLMSRLQDKVTEEEREYLAYMEKSIVKIEDMLAVMLTYSTLSSSKDDFEHFDCNILVETLISDLQKTSGIENLSINTLNLPEKLYGDPIQIRLVFEQLLDNALKFRNEHTSPIIQISAEDQDGRWVFEVKDNGIGIPNEQQESAFKIFRKLNPDEMYSGMGAGLAIVKKIIERHGGKIWIVSDCETGTIVKWQI